MEKLRQRFCEQVEFVKVYVSEAHPTDEWAVYTRKDIDYCQPKTLSERLAAARRLLTEEVIEARFFPAHSLPHPMTARTMARLAFWRERGGA